MEDDEDLTPFWEQNTTNLRRADRLRHRLSSFFFNSELLLIILLVTAIFFLVFIVPSSLSFTSTSLFKPFSSVKKSWDSFNVVLVLVAVIFGFLSKNKNEDKNPNDYQITSPINRNVQKSSPSTPNNRWFNESRNQNPTTPRTWYDNNVERNSYINHNNTSGGGLRRTFSSYPDLCEVSPRWVSGQDHWRFYDDTNVDTYRYSDSNQLNRRRSWREVDPSPEPADIKTIYEDPLESKRVPTFTQQPLSPPALPSAQPDPPQPALPSPHPAPEPVYEEKMKRDSFHSVARKKERTRKKRDHNNDNHDHELEQKQFVMAPATPPPPPPPPPPLPRYAEPRSSKSDRKRGGTSATKEFLNSLYHKKKRKNRSKSVDNLDALIYTSETPPLIPIPPPPPPPPFFKNHAWKFVVQGDYVRIDSTVSSRSGSPEPEDISSADATPTAEDGDIGRTAFAPSPLFCPSPDVNTKAENFISKFRAGLKLEKINSIKKSNLGPGVGPS